MRLLILAEFRVLDTFTLEFQRHRDRNWGHQVTVSHSFVQTIGIGRYAGFQVEQTIGVLVNFVLGRGSQAHQQ
ncbi:hypothetical protein D3C77_769530 [compost metagenome]